MENALNEFTEKPVSDFALRDDLPRWMSDLIAQNKATPDRFGERFERIATDTMSDFDLLCLILTRAMPDHDVKPLADALLRTFADFNSVITAPITRLTEIPGLGTAATRELKIVEAAAHRMAQARVIRKDVLSSWDALLSYCQTRMAHLETEQFRVLYLDRKNILIADEAQQMGTVDHVPVYPREVIKRGLELNASALILVHNHPSGDPNPSDADIEMTQSIQTGAEFLGLQLHDHLVIGKSTHYSFRSHGLI
ncbi:RadC family protein [Litoreibacter roseus]|uniref:DNA repair protein RadC n=1 Tax=Litoreibacter roseus TaxID=2601869 RepID=A0A6N6JEX2_9RHOB|nr:DNA repair protein RadC [Litoreibacter roseus]GFE64497.1 DNA repair protein RadC [Litoreibacter roseus]